jgi:superfamily I DNA/RNA helicase
MTPTPEQSAIIDAATTTQDNLMVGALAGTGKTSTLVMVTQALPKVDILFLAFNKRIADELSRKLPPNAKAQTLNSLGHRAWAETTGIRLTLDDSKMYKLLKAEIEGLSDADRKEAYSDMSETLDMLKQAKSSGYMPTGHYDKSVPLMGDNDFFESLETIPTPLQEDLIKSCMIRSIKMAFQGTVDFADQLYMPTLFRCIFPRFSLVGIDEAQDLSPLNHAMLKKMVSKRLIAIGDELQSIYAFRGAHQESMRLMAEQFSTRRLDLSVTFRCPQEVVKEAWWRAPNMKWAPWAKPGSVRTEPFWHQDDIPEHSAIICRNNAPLFSMAIKFLKNGRNCTIVGNDIGKGLLASMKKLGPFGMDQAQVFQAIDRWFEEKSKKTRAIKKLQDRAECMRIFAENGKNLGEAMAYAEHLFNRSGPVQFLTGHKSKGLEYEDVYFLDQELINHHEEEQEKNLRYVIQTRPKNSLTYINSEGYGE